MAVIHPASAGHGLNLQAGGSTLIWFGLTWSLELYQQTNARLWRQGQSSGTVVIQHILDLQVIGSGSVLRTAVIFFYISNEGVSLVENAAHLGLPVPDKLKDVLEQLHDRNGKEGQ